MAKNSKFKPLVGAYWIEALSDDELILNELKRLRLSKYLRPSKSDRSVYGNNTRLILRHMTGQAIFIWEKKLLSSKQDGIKCVLFINNSRISSEQLLEEAMKFARLCWIEATFYADIQPLLHPENFKQLLLDAGWKKSRSQSVYVSDQGSIWQKK